jgi:hypothetical protein
LNLKTNSFAHTRSVYYRERILVRHILSATCLPIINRDFLAIKEQFPFRGEIRTEQRRKANFLLESFELGTAWHVGPHGEGHHRCGQPTSDLQGVRTRVDSLVCASAHSGAHGGYLIRQGPHPCLTRALVRYTIPPSGGDGEDVKVVTRESATAFRFEERGLGKGARPACFPNVGKCHPR